jgi:creatinine amidohydrolase
MLYFAPELCKMDRTVDVVSTNALPYFRYPLKKDDVPESGALASCAYSSAEKGKVIVDKVLPELVNICKKEFNL